MTDVRPAAPGRARPRTTRFAAGLACALLTLVAANGAAATARTDQTLLPPTADSLAGNYLAALAASKDSDLGESARFFAEALSISPDDPFLLERTLVLSLASGDVDAAVDYAERLQDVDRDNPLASMVVGIDSLKHKKWAVAVQNFKRANSGPLVTLTAEILSAWAEVGGGDPKKALARLDKLDGEQWFAFFRNYHGGLIAELSGDEAEAARRFKAARAIDDGAISVIEASVRATARSGDVAGAKKDLAEAQGRVPNHPMLKALADDLAAGRKPRAQIETVAEGASEILFGLGSAISRDDGGELAMVYLQLALALDPNDDIARITLAEQFERAKRYEQAIDILSKVGRSRR